ncbi:TRAP transporter large permease [Pseudooceanicola sediminis]|uniref:TRAP transporter large permease protein n=1 Tax=Pseudooceanicola sediminis TaxID=2211117 RepID=A0A399IY53_9RHOB|nr:TRAP transporter large permease [Pseudooceanicola sediminis]KAA2312105.1 TRAP transporter large permease [Puniceibacterium sp. HSS470]RII38113.1 TRAP transporter large permease [Pseudooceanicola sediminis]|tara:strand:- start:4339 stop:5622 length:1284 start_codon:yes stop_codon:yes gene_type:complete
MIVALIVLLAVVLLATGFEMLLVLGLPALAYKQAFWAQLPDAAVVQKIVGGIDHTTLLAIPFFIFAANLMGSGQIARQLVGVIKALLGHTRGGMGHVVVGGSMAFGSVSGSAPATVAALGRMVYPEMRAAGYSERFSLGLLVASAETALLIPPSITLIVYGWITGTSISKLFAGGLAVGIVLAIAFSIFVHFQARRDGVVPSPRMGWAARLRAMWEAKWALGMPVIILGGIYSGVITPTEAAAVSVLYAIIVEMVVFRSLSWSGLFRITEDSAINTAIIFVLLAMGGLISFFVTLAQVPNEIISLLGHLDAGRITFLIVVNICFFIAGMFVDPNSTLLVLVPPLYPVALSFGIDPVHFGMIVTLNVCLGMITPPFGLDIFVASSTLGKPVAAIIRGVWPFVLLNLIVLLLITYIPQISLFVPRLIFG